MNVQGSIFTINKLKYSDNKVFLLNNQYLLQYCLLIIDKMIWEISIIKLTNLTSNDIFSSLTKKPLKYRAYIFKTTHKKVDDYQVQIVFPWVLYLGFQFSRSPRFQFNFHESKEVFWYSVGNWEVTTALIPLTIH